MIKINGWFQIQKSKGRWIELNLYSKGTSTYIKANFILEKIFMCYISNNQNSLINFLKQTDL